MISLKSLKEKAKKLDKKLDKKNPYPPMGYFQSWEVDEIAAFRKKHPTSLIYIRANELLD